MGAPSCKGQDKKRYPEVEKLIEKWRSKEGGLIPLLQETQDIIGYLPREVLEQIARGMDTSLAHVLGVVTFYAQFHVKPRGKNIIRVCMGTACHVRGSSQIMAKLEKELNIKTGETSRDFNFTLESVSCIGACGLAPVITINNDTHGRLTPDQIPGILQSYRERDGAVEEHQGTGDLIAHDAFAAHKEEGKLV